MIIEFDGSQHFEIDGITADILRDKYLNKLGLTVKRYTNIEINKDFESVCKDIYHTIYPDEN